MTPFILGPLISDEEKQGKKSLMGRKERNLRKSNRGEVHLSGWTDMQQVSYIQSRHEWMLQIYQWRNRKNPGSYWSRQRPSLTLGFLYRFKQLRYKVIINYIQSCWQAPPALCSSIVSCCNTCNVTSTYQVLAIENVISSKAW